MQLPQIPTRNSHFYLNLQHQSNYIRRNQEISSGNILSIKGKAVTLWAIFPHRLVKKRHKDARLTELTCNILN